MSENAQKPCIRFKGFSDAWEQRKFEDAFIERREKTVTENEDTLLSCAINGMFLNSELFGHFRGTTTIGYLKVKKNDLILSAQNLHLGNANVNLRFEHGIISPAYKVYDLNNCEPEFVQAWVKKEDTKNFFLAATTEGASQCRKNIEWDTLGKQTICMPAIKEQATIGSFFKCVDNLITLHQRKYDKLVAVKKSLLEKMFPADGETVPKIRFKGFSDAWEQRKLGDLVKEVTRRDPNSNAPIMMITANNGFIEQSERYAFNNAGESLKKYILLQKGELAYNHGASKLRPYGSCFALTTAENARIPFVYHCFSAERMNHEFLSIELNGNEIESQLRSIVSSGARMDGLLNISFGEYTSVSILFPKKNEQDKIADFFRQLDNLITLHQRQLEKLKNIKSALLDKMFV